MITTRDPSSESKSLQEQRAASANLEDVEAEQLEGILQTVDRHQEATPDSEHDRLVRALQQRDTALEYGLAAEAELQEVEQKLRSTESAVRSLHQARPPNDLGRHSNLPRLQRFCTNCSSWTIGDEFHMGFACPAVQPVCDKFAHLFGTPGQTMQQLLWQEDMRAAVHFVQECLCILLPDNVAASAGDNSSNQP